MQSKSHLSLSIYTIYIYLMEVTLCCSLSLPQILTAGPPPYSCCAVLTAIYFQRTYIIKYNLWLPHSFFLSFQLPWPISPILASSPNFWHIFSSLHPREELGSTLRPPGECTLVSRALDYQLSFHDHDHSAVKLYMSIMLWKASQQRSWVAPQTKRRRL